MKSIIVRLSHGLVFFACLVLVVISTPLARAGLTFDLRLIREQQGGSYYFYMPVETNSTPPAAPLGTYLIASPQQPANGTWTQFELTTNGVNGTGGGNNSFGDFDSVMQQITNGNWNIYFTNSTTTNLYQFTVSAPTLTSNMLPATIITFPTEGALDVTNQPTFTWQGASNWGVTIDAFVFTNNFGFFSYDSLPGTQTSWAYPTPIPSDPNCTIYLRYITNHTTTLLVATTPLDTNSAQPISGWVSTSALETLSYVNFSVSTAGGGGLADAVDATELTWTTYGDANWTPQTVTTHDSVDAARSGTLNVGNFESSYIETTVTGPGTVTFWWRNIVDDGDFATEFSIDGGNENDIFGATPWLQDGPYNIGAGTHTLTWTSYDDGTTDPNAAGFLDQVIFTPDLTPAITRDPFSQTNRPGYQVALLADATSPSTTPTWQWYKVGPGLISGATNKLYIPTNSGTAAVAGSYYAVASNTGGSVASQTATVTFQNAPLPPDWSRAFTTAFTNNPADTTADINLASLLDSAGNIYTVGSVTGTNVFGSNTLISVNGQESSSFLKQTATGTPIWGRSMTNNGNGSSFPRGLAAAPGDGFYVSGFFSGTNWLGTNQLVTTAGGATYLARFDANGSNLWLRTIIGTNSNFPTHHALVSDPAGNVTLSVLISGNTSFGTTNLFADGQRGTLAQYDSNGNIRWVQMPSAWPDYLTYSAGRIYGSMGGGSTNYIGGVTNLSDRRRALFSLNATNGVGHWVVGYAAEKDQGSPDGFGDNNAMVAVSGTNVFVVGTAYGTDVFFGPFSLDYPDTTGQYFARYDTNGNAQLATSFGSKFTWPWAALADAAGNVYVGCDFDTYAIFGSNVIAAPFNGTNGTIQFIGTNIDVRIPGQAFVGKFDRNGNRLWARPAQSPSNYLNLRDITLAADGVWACGFFNQIGTFGTNTIYGGTPPYHRSGYLAKITDGAAIPNPITLLSPTNTSSQFQFSFNSQSGFTHSVLYRTNLAVGTWQTWSNVTGDGTLKSLAMPAAVFGGSKHAFVRISTQ